MSRRSAAWMTVSPSGTSIRWPSISSVGMAARRLGDGPERTTAKRSVLLELGAELGDERTRRHGGGVGQRTDSGAHHVARDVEQEVDVGSRRGPVAVLEAAEHLLEPARPLAARRALAAVLVMEEALDVERGPYHAHRLVHHHDARRAKERSR